MYGPDCPFFLATALVAKTNEGFEASGFVRRCWKTTETVRTIVKHAFNQAGQPNYGPHGFRHILARHVVNTTSTPAELVATSQNLGHSGVLVTLQSYGQVSQERQRQLVTGIKPDDPSNPSVSMLEDED